jgi:hypothetical protein
MVKIIAPRWAFLVGWDLAWVTMLVDRWVNYESHWALGILGFIVTTMVISGRHAQYRGEIQLRQSQALEQDVSAMVDRLRKVESR